MLEGVSLPLQRAQAQAHGTGLALIELSFSIVSGVGTCIGHLIWPLSPLQTF
jgi:hypothetical protein